MKEYSRIHQNSFFVLFFRLCFWLDGPLSVSASVIGILINVLSIILMARKRVSKTFHLLMINLSCWDLVSWCVLIDWIKKKWILGFWSTLFNLSSWDLLNNFYNVLYALLTFMFFSSAIIIKSIGALVWIKQTGLN